MSRFATQVDFDPFFGTRSLCDCAVVTECGIFLNLQLLIQICRSAWSVRPDAARRRRRFLVRALPTRLAASLVASSSRRRSVLNVGIQIVGSIGAIDGREDRLQRVIVFLRDRIELVVVTAGALHGHTAERVERIGHHVVTIQIASRLCRRSWTRELRRDQ